MRKSLIKETGLATEQKGEKRGLKNSKREKKKKPPIFYFFQMQAKRY